MNRTFHIAVIYGSTSDLPIMQDCIDFLKEHTDIKITNQVVSAHRTPNLLFDFATKAREKGIDIIIAGAGGAAHLPGMVASLTPIPVIGVPIKTNTLNGLDSLYSIVQMPNGVPVATMAINGAKNAAILALSILGVSDKKNWDLVQNYKNKMQQSVIDSNK